MDFTQYKSRFDTLEGVKVLPNIHEVDLFTRAEKYTAYIGWIPGIEMISVVNSLSMYATHKDSDIDLFILTRPGYMWLVRIWVTLIFYILGVWRKGEDIAGNFCLSFFITTDAINLENIAIEDDIYLYYWIYYLKPIAVIGDSYERFLLENQWVYIDDLQKSKNLQYAQFIPPEHYYFQFLWKTLDMVFQYMFEWKTLREKAKNDHPKGIIISESMLKFHLEDRREVIRDSILGG